METPIMAKLKPKKIFAVTVTILLDKNAFVKTEYDAIQKVESLLEYFPEIFLVDTAEEITE